jgi:hypothetical protein
MGIASCAPIFYDKARAETRFEIVQSRERMLIQFAASEKRIVFPIPLDGEVAALAVIDRETGHRMLVSSGRSFLAFPQLSADGKRLLLIRGNQSTGHGQLLSCAVDDWRCRILVDDALQIGWPAEVRENVVLYRAAQPLRFSGTRVSYDFYLVEPSSQPVRLSTFKFYDLHSLSVSGDKIMFAAAASLTSDLFPDAGSPSVPHSDIWMLQADWKEKRLIIPAHPLDRRYVMERISTLPVMSEDGAYVAFLNGRSPAGENSYRYNLVIARIDGTVEKYLESTTPGSPRRAFYPSHAFWGFSRPAFVGRSVLANQLFDDRYETTLVDLKSNSTEQISILYHTPSALGVLERREMRIVQ